MTPALWRLIIIISCLLYAGACVVLAVDDANQSAARALWAAATAHVIFGIDAFLKFFDHSAELQKEVIKIRTELEVERAKVAELQERMAALSADMDKLRKDRDGEMSVAA